MPARTSAPPGRIPSDRTVARFPRLPEREIADILFRVFVRRAPFARALVVEIDMRELPVAWEGAHVEIDRPVLALVRHALLNELGNKRNHLGDVVRRGGIDFRRLDVERLEVGEERVFVLLRVFGERNTRGVCAADGLVVHIRQIHHLADFHTVELDDAPKNVFKRVRAEVPDMRIVVNGRSTRVEPYFVANQRMELFERARKRIEDFHRFFFL